MKNISLIVFLLFAAAKQGWCASASLKNQACNQAIRSVAKFVAPPKHKHEHFCSFHEQTAGYFIFRLNSRYPAPADAGPDWVGSNLVGYFAVSRTNGTVYNWDIAEERLGRVLQAKLTPRLKGQD